ncbi:MAG: ribbon-helix-helix protein, CopG family [Candidatus Eisenbacteria bacterium]|nr:ribbon-helix-helix protein, CopG family [Candidatus Eisenbacteria bacterium]
MSSRTKVGDRPRGTLKVVSDFLPPPSEIAPREASVRISISLGKPTVAFLRAEAARNDMPCSALIRRLIDLYVEVRSEDAKRTARTKRG